MLRCPKITPNTACSLNEVVKYFIIFANADKDENTEMLLPAAKKAGGINPHI